MSDEEQLEILNSMWNNFCVSDTYEPGSTFKPFTIAAGLETRHPQRRRKLFLRRYAARGRSPTSTVITGTDTGPRLLKQSLENSCNVALMEIGEALGAEEFCRYQELFGFGEYTGIDLPGEGDTSGLLYTPENMDPASLATNAFGQNF